MYLRLSVVVCSAFVCFAYAQLPGSDSGHGSGPEITVRSRVSRPTSLAVGQPSTHVVRADVKLVLVPVTVTDEASRPINDLPKERFRILEDGVEQQITSFSWEDGPVSLGLLFDSSGSMKGRINASVAALKYVFQTTRPDDEFFVIQFSDDVRQLGGFTSEPDEIQRRLGFVQTGGWTSLLDAVALGVHRMRSAKNPRKVLLILSDGNDNNSRFSESEIRSRVMEADVRIYAIGLSYRPRLLQRLAEETGGNVLVAQNMRELPDVVQRLSAEIRSHYLFGYTSTNQTNDGKYRKVKVELLQSSGGPSFRASWRRGYYAEGFQ
jgi:Ca-activated chloride channel family protein